MPVIEYKAEWKRIVDEMDQYSPEMKMIVEVLDSTQSTDASKIFMWNDMNHTTEFREIVRKAINKYIC